MTSNLRDIHVYRHYVLAKYRQFSFSAPFSKKKPGYYTCTCTCSSAFCQKQGFRGKKWNQTVLLGCTSICPETTQKLESQRVFLSIKTMDLYAMVSGVGVASINTQFQDNEVSYDSRFHYATT